MAGQHHSVTGRRGGGDSGDADLEAWRLREQWADAQPGGDDRAQAEADDWHALFLLCTGRPPSTAVPVSGDVDVPF